MTRSEDPSYIGSTSKFFDDDEDVQYRLYEDEDDDEEDVAPSLHHHHQDIEDQFYFKGTQEKEKEEKEKDFKLKDDDDEKQKEKNSDSGDGFGIIRWLGRTVNYLEESPTVRKVVRAAWIPIVVGLGIATVEPGITLIDVLSPINFRDRTNPTH